jgi:hypothetical protein
MSKNERSLYLKYCDCHEKWKFLNVHETVTPKTLPFCVFVLRVYRYIQALCCCCSKIASPGNFEDATIIFFKEFTKDVTKFHFIDVSHRLFIVYSLLKTGYSIPKAF